MLSDNKNRPADLAALIEGLSEAGVEFVLVGGMAAVIQGVPVNTMDMDIVHYQTEENIKRLMKFLKSADAYYRRPDDKIIEPDERDLAAKGHALFSTRYGPLDVLAIIEKGLKYEELVPDSVETEFRGHKIKVLKLETMIDLKRDSNDPKDIFRLPIFEETLRQINEKDHN
ncbi:MAG: hypothetical protein GY749_42125 [Desulfobacteraceae bacterium]|nr:hypothetical protein [Desulfobacteraceae bacterium]